MTTLRLYDEPMFRKDDWAEKSKNFATMVEDGYLLITYWSKESVIITVDIDDDVELVAFKLKFL